MFRWAQTVSLACGLCLVAAVSEANDVKVKLVSLPEGASVFTTQPDGSEKLWGTGPVTLQWKVPNKWKECFTTEAVKVRWISGVEASVTGLNVCPQTGKNQQFVFQRPVDAPGVELDVQYAVALMQSATAAAAAAEQARAARRAALLALVPPRQKICTSNIVGTQVFTYCY